MNKIESALVNIITHQPLLPIIIAYSGGVDSQVLLHSLAKLSKQNHIKNPITVCHVNHGLSDNAETWQQFAQKQCQQLNLPLVICSVNVKDEKQKSLEALAREARYSALKNINPKKSLIITGHHSDDQSETFLLALKRGSGLKGLSAMRISMPLGNHLLVRPLLKVSRQYIERYAHLNNLSWIEDESNEDTCFDRNFIRQKIMPQLTQRWPSIKDTINRSAEHCLEGQELLDELAEQDLNTLALSNTSLALTGLLTLSKARFNNLIRYFLSQHSCLMPSTEQLKQVQQQLLATDDKNPAIKVGDHYLRRFKDAVYLTKPYTDVSLWQQEVNLLESNLLINEVLVKLPDNIGAIAFSTAVTVDEALQYHHQCIEAPKEGQCVSIRFAHDNPKCLPDYRQHSRSLKKVLQELTIAPWQRKRIPFLYYDDFLVAAIGHFVCQSYLPTNKKRYVHFQINS